jgi:hypothetical protein
VTKKFIKCLCAFSAPLPEEPSFGLECYCIIRQSLTALMNTTILQSIAAATLDIAATSLQVKVTNEEIKQTLSVIKS